MFKKGWKKVEKRLHESDFNIYVGAERRVNYLLRKKENIFLSWNTKRESNRLFFDIWNWNANRFVPVDLHAKILTNYLNRYLLSFKSYFFLRDLCLLVYSVKTVIFDFDRISNHLFSFSFYLPHMLKCQWKKWLYSQSYVFEYLVFD